jgi:hypothetical protein
MAAVEASAAAEVVMVEEVDMAVLVVVTACPTSERGLRRPNGVSIVSSVF